jgi:hypothetical protein
LFSVVCGLFWIVAELPWIVTALFPIVSLLCGYCFAIVCTFQGQIAQTPQIKPSSPPHRVAYLMTV